VERRFFRGCLTPYCSLKPGSLIRLRAAIIQNIRKTKLPLESLAFFYCNNQTRKEQSLINIISALLRQFVKAVTPVSDLYITSFVSCVLINVLAKIPDEVRQHYLSNKLNNEHLDLRSALALLKSTLLKLERAFIVLDGLDECDPKFRAQLINDLRNLSPNLQLLVTSRDLPDIKALFTCVSKVHVSAMEYDLRRYLHDTIAGDLSFSEIIAKDPGMSTQIIDKICQKASGM